jgi:LmbE family N-acetylglucosaminyl deacetylase
MKRLLAIFAHPDDESWGCAGTLAKYSRAGVRCFLLTASAGEAGFDPAYIQTTDVEERKRTRLEELARAASIIGLEDFSVLGLPDGRVEHYMDELLSAVEAELERLSPSAVITFDETGITGHADHLAVHRAVTECFTRTTARTRRLSATRLFYHILPEKAFRSLGAELEAAGASSASSQEASTGIDPSQGTSAETGLLQAETANLVPKRWQGPPPQRDGSAGPHFVPDDRIDVEIDTADFVDDKLQAIRAHRSQIQGGSFLDTAPKALLHAMFSKEYYQHAAGPLLGSRPARDLFES